jgi:hypothetical protein
VLISHAPSNDMIWFESMLGMACPCTDDEVDVRPARVRQTGAEQHLSARSVGRRVAAELAVAAATDDVAGRPEHRRLRRVVTAERRQVAGAAAEGAFARRAVLGRVEDDPPDGDCIARRQPAGVNRERRSPR